MEHEVLQRKNKILHCLSCLPRKMLLLHGQDNVTEFVLHELCHEHCFNLKKAAYFVDNPDFNCLKGVAGYHRAHAYDSADDIWQSPDAFSAYMQSSPFNQKVRGIIRASVRGQGDSHEDLVTMVASDLDIKNPGYCCWHMKNDNHGVFVYEKAKHEDGSCTDEEMANGLSLLGFCPVF